MSDIEDWYEKDIEFLVNKVKFVKNATAKGDELTPQISIDVVGSNNDPDKRIGKNRDISNKKESKKKARTIPFQILKTISEREPVEIFLEISKQFFEFFTTLSANQNTPDRVLQTFIEILVILCELPLHETRKYILTKSWLKVNYWAYLLNYVERLAAQQGNNRSTKNIQTELTLTKLMSSILDYCNFFIRNLNYDRSFVIFLQNLFANYCANNEQNRHTCIGMELERLIRRANANMDVKFYNEIYPTIEDLKLEANIVKPNFPNGSYPDVHHYIDVQLAMLKEYFLSPLRDGIAELMTDSGEKIPNMRVYNEVKFSITQTAKHRKYENIVIDLNLSHNNLNPSHLIKSAKLMLGTLVCLTRSQKFDDLILAVVTNRNVERLSDGMIQTDIIKTYNQFGNIFNQTFIMLESEVYFEPYHQVYNVLKNMDHKNFPFKKYIIGCDTSSEFPDYIPAHNKVYYTYRTKVFDVKDASTWPTPESIQMDESQFAAFHDGLTRKFCMIQGPPGTGKTYIGLEIISALLQNTKQQILIICQTNHALDHFLTGTLNLTNKIVRMGSMSKNAQLDQFNIKKLLDENFDFIDKRQRIAYHNTRMEYNDCVGDFERLQKEFGKPGITAEQKHHNNAEIFVLLDKMRSVTKRLNDLNQITNFNLIKDKRVIGMTTTFAARCRSLLKMLRSPIVLLIEAGEVLESHIVATLTEETQHVIMIGDHQQLRPTTNVIKLALKYKIDISLSERMIKNGINCIRLETQHRQRPEFTNLIRPSIYDRLSDNESVHKYPDVKGVAKNLFFINHTNPESNFFCEESAVANKFEAEFLIYFCNYLIMQGHKPSEITILTLHNGQMAKLLNLQRNFQNLSEIRISFVDNFHGEENKIILLSLVRSNSNGIIGYVGMENRICVALSRAREGFFMIGNMKLLKGASPTWMKIEEELIKQNAIDNYIPLQCQTHGNITKIFRAHEFLQFTSKCCSRQIMISQPQDYLQTTSEMGTAGVTIGMNLSTGKPGKLSKKAKKKNTKLNNKTDL